MAYDPEGPPFKFTTVRQDIEFTSTSYDGSKQSKLSVSAGVYEANPTVPRSSTDKDIVYATKYEKYLTLHALQERLNDPKRREEDYTTLQKIADAKPFELWDRYGSLDTIPGTLIRANSEKPYDSKIDENQFRIWKNVANNLGGKPAQHINPKYARFLLRAPDALKKKPDLLYCTPAEPPAYGVTADKLKTIIAANTGKFDGWPDPHIIDFKTAEGMGLKLVGRNFLQFYFVWMKVEYYEELWKEYKVTELLHALPAEGAKNTYEEVDQKVLSKTRGGPAVDGAVNEIMSTTIGARDRVSQGLATDKVMGKNAKTVSEKVWGTDYITSGMGGSVKVEWLHRVAFAFGGEDLFKNLVYGTWEANTDIIRTENFVAELTKADSQRANYKGSLMTVNNTATKISRFTLAKTSTDATVPSWAKNYSWLCFSLNYRYVMDADKCPVNGGIAHDVDFDPWSIYTPLSIEPRLDVKILDKLKSESSTAGIVPKKGTLISNFSRNIQPPSSLPLPEYDSDAYPTLAWNAAINGLPFVKLPDIFVKNPTVASIAGEFPADEPIVHRPSRSKPSIPVGNPVPKGGFVLQGEVDLFGTGVVGNLKKWVGPPPDGVVIGIDPPSIELVVIPEDFHMSMLIPLLQGTPFDNIIFRNVTFYHQNYAFDMTKSIGWHFNADWVIDSSCGPLHDILTTALQVDKPILNIHASFGEGLNWSAPLNLQSFLLEGVFPDVKLSPVSGVTLTSIGVRLLGVRGFSLAPEPHSTLSFGFGIFGTMNLDVPGSVVPLNLDYEIGLAGSIVSLRAELSGSIWENALGVKGLLLEDVAFGTTFSTTSPWNTFAFDVSATFSYLSSQAYLQGSYAAGGHFSLTAEVDDFGVEEIDGLFYAIYSDSLTLPEFDVHIGSAIISIESGQGLSVSLLDVNIGGHTAASVSLALSSSGVSLSGALSTSTVKFGDVELRDAVLKLSFWTVDKKKNVDCMLGGTLGVDFLAIDVTAVAHLYPGKGGVEWAVVAELSAPGRPFATSDIVPEVKDSFVDFSLGDAMFIAASMDDPLIGESFPAYQVRKGVEVFGMIDHIQALDDLLRGEMKGLVFNAGWLKDSGFSLFVFLPAEFSIDLGNGIKTTPITVGIRTSPPELAIKAGVKIPVKDSAPLDFSFVLAANVIRASASAQMGGWWVGPFGIENLKIGPEVTLSIEIIYAQFVSTGTPSGFGVSGGLMIGSIQAFLAMNVNEDPQRQLLFGEVKNLDISDVVEFAGTLVGQEIPKIPDNLLKFEELKVYICPFGVVIGQTVYPQGFSFKADMLVLQTRANIECTIDKANKSVDIVGGIDNLVLGPLTVRGSKGPRATLECHVGAPKQQLFVDGVVKIFDAMAQTYVDLEFLPNPKLTFYLLLQFADVFTFQLNAQLDGSLDEISTASYSASAELTNDILEYIAQQVIEQFEAAKAVATQGLEAARKQVDAAKKDWEDGIAAAQKRVDNAEQIWKSYEERVEGSSQQVIDYYESEINRLQDKVDKARRDYDAAMNDAQRKLDQAYQDSIAALASAEGRVQDAKRTLQEGVDQALRKLQDAEAELSRGFGDALRAIDKAEGEVRRIQNEIDAQMRTIHEFEHAPFWEFWKKCAIPALLIGVDVLEIALGAATGTLEAARAILTTADYIAKEVAVRAAKEALKLAQSVGEATLKAAQEALRALKVTCKTAVDTAEATLESVKTGSEYVAFEGAKEALDVFKKANEAAYEAAIAAVKGLMDSAEYAAFTAAKAGLEVARGSTKLLDAANEALALAETASQAALSILEEIVKFGANAVYIKKINLSGTIGGVVGIDGTLLAVIEGYIVGKKFNIRAKFDPRNSVKFITEIFQQLWDMMRTVLSPGQLPAPDPKPVPPYVPLLPGRHTGPFPIDFPPYIGFTSGQGMPSARSGVLQQQPNVHRMLADMSEPISTGIPRGPFSGTPIVSSAIVARRAFTLMQIEKGISVFNDHDAL